MPVSHPSDRISDTATVLENAVGILGLSATDSHGDTRSLLLPPASSPILAQRQHQLSLCPLWHQKKALKYFNLPEIAHFGDSTSYINHVLLVLVQLSLFSPAIFPWKAVWAAVARLTNTSWARWFLMMSGKAVLLYQTIIINYQYWSTELPAGSTELNGCAGGRAKIPVKSCRFWDLWKHSSISLAFHQLNQHYINPYI